MEIITDLVEKKRLWYDLPNFTLYIIQFTVSLSCLWLHFILKMETFLCVFLMFVTVVISGSILRRRFGWIINNYVVLGTLSLDVNAIKIKKSDENWVEFEVGILRQIYVDTNYYQNCTDKTGTYSGIGTIKLYQNASAMSEFNFILYDRIQYEHLLTIKDIWNKIDKLRLY
jgi:hypothetical protein